MKKHFLILVSLSLVVRMGLFFFISKEPLKFYSNSDSYNYEHIALNLLHHGEFSSDTENPLTPNLYRTPVYPVFIAGIYALTDESPYAVVFIQLLIGSLISALMLVLAKSLHLSQNVGWLAGLILALDPLITLTSYQMITETLFTGLMISAIITFSLYFRDRKWIWLVSSAVLFALTSLTRPISQYLPFLLLPLFFLAFDRSEWNHVWKGILIFSSISMILTYSWAYRNYQTAKVWTLSAIAEQNLLYYRARDVISAEKNISEQEAAGELEQYIQTNVKKYNLSPAQEIRLMHSKATEIFLEYPVSTFKVHTKGFIKVLANPGLNLFCVMLDSQKVQLDDSKNVVGCASAENSGLIAQLTSKLKQMNPFAKSVSILEIIMMAAMYAGTAFGSWRLWQQKQWFILSLLLIPLLYFSVLSAGGESVARFRIPMVPFLSILTGIGCFKHYLQEKEIYT
jgi:4-amino-4-deoxy-L-arabinose transferase-like glycosyltransferase